MEIKILLKIVIVIVLLSLVAAFYIDSSPIVTGLVIVDSDRLPTTNKILGVGNSFSLMFSPKMEQTEYIIEDSVEQKLIKNEMSSNLLWKDLLI